MTENSFDGVGLELGNRAENTMFGTVGLMLFPNTWKLSVSYTGKIGDNVLYEDSDHGNPVWNGAYIIDEGEKDLQWFEIYAKPLSTKVGDFGIGYSSSQQSTELTTTNYKILDYANVGNTAALVGNGLIRYQTKIDTMYFTYNIPSRKSWYNGFGVSYAYETANRAKKKVQGSIVVKPDTTTSIISLGINKTLDELNNGLSFKKLTLGVVDSEHKYYDHDLQSNQTFTTSGNELNMEVAYMFKPKKNKKIYLLGGFMTVEDDASTYDRIKFELGLIF